VERLSAYDVYQWYMDYVPQLATPFERVAGSWQVN
jgi:hypothetical protein